MGYIFTIEFDSKDQEIKAYIEQLKKEEKENKSIDEYDKFDWCDRYDGYVRWDNYEKDISRVSEKFPNVLITLYQEHEDNELSDYYDGRIYENSNMTVQYFKYGKFTKEKPAKITISFDWFNDDDEKFLSA